MSPRLIGPDGGHLCGNPPLSLTATGVRAEPDPKANSGSVANEPFMVTAGSTPGYIEFATAGFWLTLPVCVDGSCPAACPTCGAGIRPSVAGKVGQ